MQRVFTCGHWQMDSEWLPVHCGDQRHKGLCLDPGPCSSHRRVEGWSQGTTLSASDLHNSLATILNPIYNMGINKIEKIWKITEFHQKQLCCYFLQTLPHHLVFGKLMNNNYVGGSLRGPYRNCSTPKEEYTDCSPINVLLTNNDRTQIYSPVQRWVSLVQISAILGRAITVGSRFFCSKWHVAIKCGANQETGSHLMRYGGIDMGHGDRKIATKTGSTTCPAHV